MATELGEADELGELGEPGFDTMLDQAVTCAINAYAADLPPLRWGVTTEGWVRGTTGYGYDDGYEERYSESEAAETLIRWADRLGLRRVRQSVYPRGTVEYQGCVDGWQVEIWGVVDRPMFRKEHYANADPGADPARS